MATFPRLKTGAVMQHPARRSMEYSTQVLRFVDGSEQRFRDFPDGIRRWLVRLDLLDEAELNRLREFFVEHQGRFGSFTFFDPWDEVDCSFDTDAMKVTLEDELRGGTTLPIRRNPR